MLTSKERAELRAQANNLDTLLMVGKGGITDTLITEAIKLLECRELVKGKVAESAMMSAREASDAICEGTGADGVLVVGSKFVIYRKSQKLAREKKEKENIEKEKKANPVRKGAQIRRKRAQADREQKNQYFKKNAIEAAIARRKVKETTEI